MPWDALFLAGVMCRVRQTSYLNSPFFSHNLNGDNRTMTLVEISENQSSMQCKGMQLRPPRQAFQPECLGQFWIKMSKIIQALTSKVLGMPSGFSF